jgi:hypothetical protein
MPLPIRSYVADIVRKAALANGITVSVTGSTCPADDAGLDSPQLLHATGQIARRLGVEIPVEENVFYDGRRPRTVDEIVAHVSTFAPVSSADPTPADGLAAPLPPSHAVSPHV